MILVDERNGSAELAPLLSSPNAVCRLDFADFAWSGHGPDGNVDVGAERKSLMDLLNSMTTGRLSGHQMVGLTQNYDRVYIIVEGVWRPDRHSGIIQRINRSGKWVAASQGSRRFMARDVYNFLNTLQVMCGVQVVQTSSQWETAIWLDATYNWWQKPWAKHKSHLQFQQPTVHAHLTKPNLVTRVASQFEGIGWDKARAIGSAMDLWTFMNADAEDFMEIKGIGKVLAQSIIEQRRKG